MGAGQIVKRGAAVAVLCAVLGVGCATVGDAAWRAAKWKCET
jgi:hypothetical protein